MKKSLLLLLVSSSVASAQTTFEVDRGTLRLDACVADQGQVRCDFTLTPKSDFYDDFSTRDVAYITGQGEKRYATKVRLMNDAWTSGYTRDINGVGGIPIKVSYMLDAKPTGALRFLVVDGTNVPNVAVRGAPAAATPATVSMQPTKTTVTAGGFVITLSGCVKSGNDYKCSSAVLSPK